MKKVIATTIVLMVAVFAGYTSARTELTIVIPTAHEARVLEAITAMGGAKFQLIITSTDPNDPWVMQTDSRSPFFVEVRDPNDTAREFGEKFGRQLMVGAIECYEDWDADEVYDVAVADAIAAVPPPDANTPDGILE